jgi:hypothetical protein
MAQIVRCFCGKEYRLSFRHVGRPLRCKVCGRQIPVEEWFHEQEREDFEERDAPDDEDNGESDRCCEACVQFAPGQVYHFYAGKQRYNYRNRYLGVNLAKYTNVGQHHAYLCDRCITRAWRFRYGWRLLAGLVPGALLFPPVLLLLMLRTPAGLCCLLPASVLAGVGALCSGYFGVRLALGAQTRDDRERVTIQLMRSRYSRTCDCFWTTREYDRLMSNVV